MPQRNVATNFTFEQQRQEINLLAADFWTHKGDTDTAAPTYLKHDGSNAFTGQTLAVPNAFTINANSGTGTVTITGNLSVSGTTTTVNSANLEVTDKNILIAKGSTSDANSDGAGITIDSATDITFNFVDSKDALVSSIGLEATTHLKAARGQFTGSTTPTIGQGIEINAPDANSGQIISYDRGNTAYKTLRLKGSTIQLYGGTSNALVGSFSSTGLGVTGNVTSDTFIQVLGAAGTSDKGLEVRSNSDQTTTTNKAIRVRNNSDTDTFSVSYKGSVDISDNLSMSKSGLGLALFRSTDDDMRVRIRAANDKFSQLEFADDDADAGEIKYKHATDDADYMSFHVFNNTERMRVTAEGKLGIGMNSDQQTNGLKGKLDIDASGIDAAGDTDDPNDYAIVIRNSSTTNQGNGIAFTNDSGQHVGGAIIHIDKGSNNLGDLAFYTAATSSTPEERLRIKSDGIIGVNNTEPEGKGIDVAHSRTNGYTTNTDTRNLAHIIARNSSDGAGRFAALSFINGGGTQAEGSINLVQTGNYTGDLTFKLRTSVSGWQERLRIISDGRVQIGANNSAFGQLCLNIPSQAGGAALQVMNTNAGSGDNTLTNIVLRSVNNSGSNWAHAEYRASSHIFAYQGTQKFTVNSNGAGVSGFITASYFKSSGPGGGQGIRLEGLAAGSGSNAVDTGISVNQGNASATMLVIGSRNTSDQQHVQGYAWLLRFAYNGNHLPAVHNITGNSAFWSIRVSSSNTLEINGNAGNWQFGGIWVT